MLDKLTGKTSADTAIGALLQLSKEIYPIQSNLGLEGPEWGGLAYSQNGAFRITEISHSTRPIRYRYNPTLEQQQQAMTWGNRLAGFAHGHPSGGTFSLGDYKTSLNMNVPITAVGSNGSLYLFDPTSLTNEVRSNLLGDVDQAIAANERQGGMNTEGTYMRNLSPEAKALLLNSKLYTECAGFFK